MVINNILLLLSKTHIIYLPWSRVKTVGKILLLEISKFAYYAQIIVHAFNIYWP
jgi:sporulation protein YlmC with PRC-barrel domain